MSSSSELLADARAGDAVLATLLMPFAQRELDWPAGNSLFLRARPGPALQDAPRDGLVCEQTFKPTAEALQRAGYPLQLADDQARYDLVLVLPTRQREESRALFARAIDAVAAGGVVISAAANTEGARTFEDDLARLAGDVRSISKHKCRVFWCAPHAASARLDTALLDAWRVLDAPRAVADGRFVSRPGLFAWDRIDPATALLAESLPTDLDGRVADLGAGHGVLSALLLERCPKLRALTLFEAEARALDLAPANLATALAGREKVPQLDYRWHDVTTGVPGQYDVIVSNPPFHRGPRAAVPEIGKQFIVAAAASLRPGGALWLVANAQLPYEAELARRFGRVRQVTERDGYKVIEAVRTIHRGAQRGA